MVVFYTFSVHMSTNFLESIFCFPSSLSSHPLPLSSTIGRKPKCLWLAESQGGFPWVNSISFTELPETRYVKTHPSSKSMPGKALNQGRKPAAVQQVLDCLWSFPVDVNGWLGAPRPSGGFTCSGPPSRRLRLPDTWFLGEDGYSSLNKPN